MRNCLVVAACTPLIVLAQAPGAKPAPKPAAAKQWVQPKTPWGDPDIQGMWPGVWGTPLERPKNLGTRATLTVEEFTQRAEQNQRQNAADRVEFGSTSDRIGIGPPSYWTERGHPTRQASLIIDPPDGRIPALTPEAKARTLATPAEWKGVANSWEDLNLYYRCITRGVIGTTLPAVYDNGNQIVQSPGYVVIRQEMIHETRVIPVVSGSNAGRGHAGQNIRMYMGDSRGHWEGNTLVVETTNFTGKTSIGNNGVSYNGSGGHHTESLKLIERFTRVDANTLNYQVTIDDPNTWERPWTLQMPLERDDHYGFYEYACHEGNYAMKDILTGARALEREALAK